MAPVFSSVLVFHPSSKGGLCKRYDWPIILVADYDPQGLSIKFKKDHHNVLHEFLIHQYSECSRIVPSSYIITIDWESFFLNFKDDEDMMKFHSLVNEVRRGKTPSVFSQRTEDSSAIQYFQFYGYLSQQQNMLQDYVRTSTYQRAILINGEDFKDRVVLDVGAGSGILSFFAVQAGAAKVYAVEASSMALHAESLVVANNLQSKIQVIAGKIEEIDLPEKVDIIISEPMGYMLYNERMLETYLHAKKWLKPLGKMFPSQGDLHIAPFMDDALYMEQTNKANFWVQTCFHGVDLSFLRGAAMKEYFRQPIVDTFDMRICLAKSIRHSLDFTEAAETDLHKIVIPLEFTLLESGTVHGLAFWFDVAFVGSVQTIWLSTAPTESLTHWYQVRCLLETPILAKAGQVMTGIVVLEANQRQSYDVTIELGLEDMASSRSSNTLDLKNPYFRYTGQPVVPPPGSSTTSPSEAYWQQLDSQNRQAINIVTEGTLKDIVPDTSDNLANSQCVVTQTNMHLNAINGTDKLRVPLCLTSSGTLISSPLLAPQQNSSLPMALVDGDGQMNDGTNSLVNDYVITGSNPLDAHNYRS